MNIYVVIIEDRHTDVLIEAFTTAESAVLWAKDAAEENASDDFEVEEMTDEELEEAGWLYFGKYSGEVDCVRVVEVEVDSQL